MISWSDLKVEHSIRFFVARVFVWFLFPPAPMEIDAECKVNIAPRINRATKGNFFTFLRAYISVQIFANESINLNGVLLCVTQTSHIVDSPKNSLVDNYKRLRRANFPCFPSECTSRIMLCGALCDVGLMCVNTRSTPESCATLSVCLSAYMDYSLM